MSPRRGMLLSVLAIVIVLAAACAPAPAFEPSSAEGDESASSTSADGDESQASDQTVLAGRPSEPAVAEDFRADSSAHIAATGRPQLVEFFAYWCSVCQAMRPTVHQLEADYWGEVDFVYLDIDDPDNEDALEEFGFIAQPLFVLIDEEGNIIQRWVGTVPDEELRNSLDQATSS